MENYQLTRRSKPWGSYWLKRYNKEGIKGLRDKPRGGRIPQISLSISTRIRKTLRESRHGWTTRQANDLIVKESEYTFTIHMYIGYCIDGVSNRKCQEKYM
jgi:transposase